MQYLCKAGQQVRAKAQDSAPDKDRMPLLGAPSLAGQASTGSANAAGWLSTESGQLTLLCLLYQQGLGRSDYWTSTTFQEPSTDIGYKKKKRLAKSGKDTIQKNKGLYTCVSSLFLRGYSTFSPQKDQYCYVQPSNLRVKCATRTWTASWKEAQVCRQPCYSTGICCVAWINRSPRERHGYTAKGCGWSRNAESRPFPGSSQEVLRKRG